MALSPISGPIFRLITSKHRADHLLRWAGKPMPRQAADPQAELDAVTRHGGNDGAVFDAVRRIHRRFTHRHPRRAGEVVAAGDKLKHFALLLDGVARLNNPRRQRLNQQRRPALLRLWHSSPICSACASIKRRSISPIIFIASRSIGPCTSRIQFRRSITLWSLAPVQEILRHLLAHVGISDVAVGFVFSCA